MAAAVVVDTIVAEVDEDMIVVAVAEEGDMIAVLAEAVP